MVYKESVEKNAKLPGGSPCPTLNDDALMRALQAGSSPAYALLVDRYHRLVLLTAWRVLSDLADAETLAEVVLREIAQAAAEYDPTKGMAKKWISEQAYRRSISHKNALMLQKRNPRAQALSELPEVCSDAPPNKELLSRSPELLSHGQQQVVKMVLQEGLSFAEVARRTNQKIGRIRRDYYRAVDRMCNGASARTGDQEGKLAMTLGRIRRANA